MRRFLVSTSVLGLFLLSGGVPTPLYAVYAERWGFGSPALTAVFAVYALALLVALVCFGDLSDAIGRRPVVLTSTALLVVGLALFAVADGVVWLLAARVVQGAAVGLLTAAASAAMLDTEPGGRARRASLANVVAAMGGQALGALGSGALVQYGPAPLRLVYLLVIALAVGTGCLFAAVVPETVPRRRRFALHVRLGIPAEVRGPFLAAAPCLVATWAISSFYLSLGPSLVATLTGTDDRLAAVSASVALLGAGTAAAILARRRTAQVRMLGGCATLGLGAALAVVSLATTTTALFFASTAIAGLGFGTAFAGALETLTSLAPDDARGELVSAIYVVAYVSFSVPAVIAGIVSTGPGLVDTAIGYSAAVSVLSIAALWATRATLRGTPAARTAPDDAHPANRDLRTSS